MHNLYRRNRRGTFRRRFRFGSILIGIAVLLAVIGYTSFHARQSRAQSTSTEPNLKVAFIGDDGVTSNSRAVLRLIKNEGAAFVIDGGDLDYQNNPTTWDTFITSELGANYPYFVSVGNHDVAQWPGYRQKLQERLARVPDANCTGVADIGNKSYCNYKGLFFLTSGIGSMGSKTDHEAFIKQALSAGAGYTWKICSWHHNMQKTQIGGKSDVVGWTAYEDCRKAGAIIANAHEHSYERTKTLIDIPNQTVDPSCNLPNFLCVALGKTFLFVSGLGGSSIRDQELCLPATYPYGCKGEWANIYTATQPPTSGGSTTYGALFIVFNYNGDPGKAHGYFKNIRGEIIDEFDITTCANCPVPTSPPPTSTPIPTPTTDPTVSGVKNLVVNDTANAADWSLQSNLQVGNEQFGDRTYQFSTVPSAVAGSYWIRTAADSKAYTSEPLATFTAAKNITVFVAHNDLLTTKPAWLSGWTDSGMNIVNNEATPKTFSLFRKDFSANNIVTLGSNGSTTEVTYTVIVQSLSATLAPSASPTPGSTSPTTIGASPTTPPSCTPVPTDQGVVSAVVNFPTTGTYKAWSRMMATDATNNSYYLQIDDTCAVAVGDSSIMPLGSWTWIDYQNGNSTSPILLSVGAGNHTVKLIGKEVGTKLDHVFFTPDQSCIPTGSGDNCITPVTPTASPTMTPPASTMTPTRVPSVTSPVSTATPTPVSGSVKRVPQDYATIQAAINAAATGDTILVAPGTYVGAVILNKGVTLLAESYDKVDPRRNTVIIDGNGGADGVITIPSGVTTHPKIIGFALRNAGSGVFSNSIFTIEYSYLTGGDDLAEYERGSGGINRNNIYVGAGDDSIDLDNQINNVTIENNWMLRSSQEGIEMRLQDDTISGNPVDVVIRNNKFELSGNGGAGDGIQFIDYNTDTKRRILVEGNLFLNSRQSGIGLMCCEVTNENYEAASIREEIRVINNTFVGNNHGITGGDDMLVLNNIFMNTTNIALKNVDNASRISHNLFWNNGTNYSGTVGTNDVLANPLLNTNYQLQAGSPAIDAGIGNYTWTNLFGQQVTFTRSTYVGPAPDLGWLETGSSSELPTPTFGPSVTPIPTAQFSPTPPVVSGIISNMVVTDTANASDWSIRPNLEVSDQQFGDRAYIFTAIPTLLRGNDWIRTAADSKTYTGSPLVTFTVTKSATVYVAHTDKMTTKPSWLSTWTNTGMKLENNEATPNIFTVYSKPFAANSVVSLGENGGTTEVTYTVIVKEQINPTLTSTPIPTWTPVPTMTPVPTSTPVPSPTNSVSPTPTVVPTPTPATIALMPAEDAAVSSQQPTRNYGTSNTLWVDGVSPVEMAFLKFNLSQFAGQNVTRAVLRIYVTGGSMGTQTIKSMNDISWRERGITYDNRPRTGAVVTTNAGGTKGEYREIDVTAAVVAKTGGILTLSVEQGHIDGFDFASKDNNNAAYRPQLVVTTQ